MITDFFKPAQVENKKLRLCFEGPAGSGKTYTALTVAKLMGWKTAMIDTERGSASIYANEFKFDAGCPPDHDPAKYIQVIRHAIAEGYDCLIIDSISHVWNGVGGFLDMADQAAARMRTPNSYTAWKEVTPLYNQFIETLLGADIHIIATMRSKVEYTLQQDERGRSIPKKMGMAPIQREGMDYEFDFVGAIDQDTHTMRMTKARQVEGVNLDNRIFVKPGEEFVDELKKVINHIAQPNTVPAPKVNKPTPEKVLPVDAQQELPFEPDPPKVEEKVAPKKRTTKPIAPKAEPEAVRDNSDDTGAMGSLSHDGQKSAATIPPSNSGTGNENVISEEQSLALIKEARTYGWNKISIKKLLEENNMPLSVKELKDFQAQVIKQLIKDKETVQRLTVDLYEDNES